MKFFNKLSISLLLFTLFLTPARGFAGEPTTQLSTTINEFANILVNTPVAELRAMGLPARALDLVFGRCDFSEMTKRSLGRHWGALAPAEQREFVKAFTQKLLVAYGRTVRASGDERIHFQVVVIPSPSEENSARNLSECEKSSRTLTEPLPGCAFAKSAR